MAKRYIKKVTQWRNKKTGKFTKKPTTAAERKRVKKSEFIYRTSEHGEHVAGIPRRGVERIVKKAPKGALKEWDGVIGDTLDSMNVTSTIMRPSSASVYVTISGRVKRGKKFERRTVKISLNLRDVGKRRFLREVLIGKIVEALQDEGLRTQYAIKLVTDWSHKKTRKYESQRFREIEDATITAIIHKD
jgi:hypothetical protein